MTHSPNDLLQWVGELKPDMFHRTFSMYPAVSLDRPIPDGFTVGSFLDALAKVSGGYHLPRLDAKPDAMTDDQFKEMSARLLDLPLTPRMKFLSIDNYPPYFSQRGPRAAEQLLQSVLDQGWEGIELLVCGSDRRGMYKPPPATFGKAASLIVDVPAPSFDRCGDLGLWDTNRTCLDWVRGENPGSRILMNVDFPAQIDCFKQLGADGMAKVLSKVAAEQQLYGFTFIWPLLQVNPPPNNVVGQWDATQYLLSDGRRLLDVERDLILKFNAKASVP